MKIIYKQLTKTLYIRVSFFTKTTCINNKSSVILYTFMLQMNKYDREIQKILEKVIQKKITSIQANILIEKLRVLYNYYNQ